MRGKVRQSPHANSKPVNALLFCASPAAEGNLGWRRVEGQDVQDGREGRGSASTGAARWLAGPAIPNGGRRVLSVVRETRRSGSRRFGCALRPRIPGDCANGFARVCDEKGFSRTASLCSIRGKKVTTRHRNTGNGRCCVGEPGMTKDETAEICPPVRTVYGPSAYTVHPGSVGDADTFPSGMQLKLQLRRLLLCVYKLTPKKRARGLTEWGSRGARLG